MRLFQLGKFTSAAGLRLNWKIECDALTETDWFTIAEICGPQLQPYGSVIGVPRGGLTLAKLMQKFITDGPPLIVDDVWTTGGSIKRTVKEHGILHWNGFVAFARGKLDPNVRCFLQTEF